MRDYLFISGCGRSGTTALAQLIGSHRSIVMGIERYGKLEREDNFALTEELFATERFLEIREGDTFYSDFDKFHCWDRELKSKIFDPDLKYIGDKKPTLFMVYDRLFEAFPNAKVIFIYRDIYEVAESWNKRAEHGVNWPKHKDYRQAVTSWNDSLENTLENIRSGKNIVCVNYGDLFIDQKDISSIFESLGLDIDDSVKAAWGRLMEMSCRLVKSRGILSDEQKEYVKENARFDYLEKINEYNVLRDL